jgi:DNA-binding PadR family transcriptional regulator
MPRTKSTLSPAECAILGLVQRQPMHGYQIARETAPNEGIGLVCPLGVSNVYFLLGNLERRGLIEIDHRDEEAYPPRTVYKATARGRKAFAAWMRSPVERLRQVRMDFLLKRYFLGEGKREEALELVDRQIDFCLKYLAQWQALGESVPPYSFDRLAMEAKSSVAEATLEWLGEYRRRVEQGAGGQRQPVARRRGQR